MDTQAEMNAGKKPPGPELVFGLVGALGADLDLVGQLLKDELDAVGYTTVEIRLSTLLHATRVWARKVEEKRDAYIEQHQKVGNLFASAMKRPDALALLAINEIRKVRKEKGDDPDRPQERRAYILRQLKRPGEVTKLREVYGDAFFLVAAYSARQLRIEELRQKIAEDYHEPSMKEKHEPKATELINRDQVEVDQYGVDEFGQNVRDTFPRADVFLDVSKDQKSWLPGHVKRFIELLFGYPFHTPTREEYVMFHAKAASVRSADLSRQVGAAIATDDGEVVAVGTNEVPKVGIKPSFGGQLGGQYWHPDQPDHRDFTLKKDQSLERKKDTLAEILARLEDWFVAEKRDLPQEQRIEEALQLIRGTQLMNIGEFGRTVHAEMAALLDAARRGASVRGLILYTTTFPCQNCAKHIIASGISQVIYMEPYPKSYANILHADEIVEGRAYVSGKISFASFIGISPRQYLRLFSMISRKTADGKIPDWHTSKRESIPRYPAATTFLAYVPREKTAVGLLNGFLKEGTNLFA
jgi:deoxycytidylate deaminase